MLSRLTVLSHLSCIMTTVCSIMTFMKDRRSHALPHLDIRDVLQRNPDDLIKYVDFQNVDMSHNSIDVAQQRIELTSFQDVAQAVEHISPDDGFGIIAHELEHRSKPHFHDYVEVTHVLKGSVMLWIEGRTEIVRAGGTIAIQPGAKHLISPVGGDADSVPIEIDMLVSETIINRMRALAPHSHDEAFHQWASSLSDIPYIAIGPDKNPSLESAINRLIVEYGSSEHSLHYAVVGNLLECVHYLSQTLDERAHADPLIASIQQIIDRDIAHISIESIAHQLGYSVGYLSRYSKSHSGKTLGTLINETRLNEAATALTQSELTIAEITRLVGFTSPSYFHKIFQKRFSLTPKQYRNAFLKTGLGT
ncbi:helix-turn-helix domain-containing protein [Bifidobacterium lemurum]|uniref:helix-turn-helix domain-containing protein n=1 Tax=Bifidobacterium lemurum TaxID=1603886 RepID=UPI0011600CA2|nr:helix-turn-helix domain-containing protein [Bifidobacterium lemurum]QOL34503.1 AraC family transcriptional regulator [Bifidobacterium lemurum]